MPYTEAHAKASAKYYQKVREQKITAYRERYNNDEDFRKREIAKNLANYYKRKEQNRQQLLSETSETSETSENSD
jgi:hypothetical protein